MGAAKAAAAPEFSESFRPWDARPYSISQQTVLLCNKKTTLNKSLIVFPEKLMNVDMAAPIATQTTYVAVG